MGAEREGAQRDDDVAGAADRALTAQQQARDLAERLADTARDIAATLDRVAQTREARAEQVGGAQAAVSVEGARRAREKAEGERRDEGELRRTWNLPDRDGAAGAV